MNEIVMMPVAALMHHPENPRKDLGDLTELAESIKKNGVMQNLTVVRAPEGETGYMVVIGNRRMEAAKMAGVATVPCVISDMDHKTRIAQRDAEAQAERAAGTVLQLADGIRL